MNGLEKEMRLGILDYGAGNLRSVLNAFEAIRFGGSLVTQPADFDDIDVLVFPGQGAFGDSVRILKDRALWQPLQRWLLEERPYLGICLGYQLLFERSEESPGVEGLGVAPGIVKKFQSAKGLKIPHMGWNEVQWNKNAPSFWKGLPNPCHMYFVHSYYPVLEDDKEALCWTHYGERFASGIARKNLLAVQFHPEKSQALGLQLLVNAVEGLSVDPAIVAGKA